MTSESPQLSSINLISFDLATFFFLSALFDTTRLGPFGALHMSLGRALGDILVTLVDCYISLGRAIVTLVDSCLRALDNLLVTLVDSCTCRRPTDAADAPDVDPATIHDQLEDGTVLENVSPPPYTSLVSLLFNLFNFWLLIFCKSFILLLTQQLVKTRTV